MEWKDITVDGLKTNRPDLFQTMQTAAIEQGKTEADKISEPKIKTLTEEKEKIEKEADTLKAKDARAVQTILANKLLAESELPDCAKTEVFTNQLLAVKEKKDGDKVVTAEEGMKALIQDRMDATDPEGVVDNEERIIIQSKTGKEGQKAEELQAIVMS